MIHDNVLVAHELMHYLYSSKNSPNKGCVVKLDMSKAYDRVKWSFLENVMKNMGFSSAWVNKIMDCVCTVRYRAIRINPMSLFRRGVSFKGTRFLLTCFFFVWMPCLVC